MCSEQVGNTNAGPKAGIGRAGQEADPSCGSFGTRWREPVPANNGSADSAAIHHTTYELPKMGQKAQFKPLPASRDRNPP